MVGNGVVGLNTLETSTVEVYYGHHLISTTIYNQYQQYCISNPNGIKCNLVENAISALVTGVNPYFIYGYCWNNQ